MEVKVRNAVPRVAPHVEHQPVPTLGDAFGLGNLPGGREHLGDDLGVVGLDGAGVFDVLAWDHEHMDRSSGIYVTERVGSLRRGNFVARELSRNDSAEQAVAHSSPTLPFAAMDPADHDPLARWLADARAEEDVAARGRVRRLVDQAAEEGTLLTACLDLAERSATVRIDTAAGRAIHGVIAGAGRDFLLVAGDGIRTLVALRAVVAVRTSEPGSRPPAGARQAPHSGTFVDALTDLMADRLPVAVVVDNGTGEPLRGTVVAVGSDVVTLQTEGEAPTTVYSRLESLVAVLLRSEGPASPLPFPGRPSG